MKRSLFFLSLLILFGSCEEQMILESRDQDPTYTSIEILVSYQNSLLLNNEELTIDLYATRENARNQTHSLATIKPDLQGRVTKGFLDVTLGNIYIRVNEPQFGTYIGVETLMPDVKSFHFVDFVNGYYYESDDTKIKAPDGVSMTRPMVGQKSKFERFIGQGSFFETDETTLDEFLTLEIVEFLEVGKYKVQETMETPEFIDEGILEERNIVTNIWDFNSGILKVYPEQGFESNSYFFGDAVNFNYTLNFSSKPVDFVTNYIKENPSGYYRFFNLDLPYGSIPESALKMINNLDIGSPSFLHFYKPDEGFLKVYSYSQNKFMDGYRRVD